jgi:hypothetical protein
LQWQALGNPFRRRGRTPPKELQRGQVIEPLEVDDVAANIPPRNYNGLALGDRLGTFAAQQGEKLRSKKKSGSQHDTTLPVTIIPAQPRGQTWSPDIIRQQQEAQLGESSTTAGTQHASAPTTSEHDHSYGGSDPSEVINSSASPKPTHIPRIQFSPATPLNRQHNISGLGAEVRRPPSAPSSPSPLDESTSTIDFSRPEQHTRTDHDR